MAQGFIGSSRTAYVSDFVLGSAESHATNPLIIKKYLNSNFTDVTFSVTKRRNHKEIGRFFRLSKPLNQFIDWF